jgi:lysophospholipase L1-like esterase
MTPRHLRSPPPALWIASLAIAIATPAAEAQTTIYAAFGDSITEGINFDELCTCQCREECGYPRRAEGFLNGAGFKTVFSNRGRGGETTPMGLSRFDTFLDIERNSDVVLLMEGTNDVGRISRETTLFNLTEMAVRTEDAGLEAAHATLIPRWPGAVEDFDNVLNERLARDLRDLAYDNGRRLFDPFDAFINTPGLFNLYYADVPEDPVGHPNASGYDKLARVVFNVLRDRDIFAPVVGTVEPEQSTQDASPFAPVRFMLYDFGVGVDLAATRVLINGLEVPYTATGDPNAYEISYFPTTPLPETVVVSVVTRDLESPPNAMTDEVTRFTVAEIVAEPCEPDEITLCIDHQPGDGRFKVTMTWHTALNGGQSGDAFATPLTGVGLAAGGMLSFFDGNPEVLVKVLNGCGSNGHFWLFASPTTNLGYVLEVEDTLARTAGAAPSEYEKVLINIDGNIAQPYVSIEAFPTCIYNLP